MKLRNKKTGEMGIVSHFDNQSIVIYPVDENWNAKGDKKYVYHSLTELNEEWEDAPEEPKEHCSITQFGEVIDEVDGYMSETIDEMKQIGNYFETKEEAEKAVEKLKAWKRLKDKGIMLHLQKQFRSDGVGYSRTIYTDFSKDSEEIIKDLDICFGGEE